MADTPPRRIDRVWFVLLVVAWPFATAAAWLARIMASAARALATAVSLPVWLWRSRHDDW
jgi:Flp pilus assembly protein TadB